MPSPTPKGLAGAALYLEGATMYAKPFGTFQGRPAIQGFWADLIQKGAHDLQYRNVTFEEVTETKVLIGADWSMSIGGGVISRETWVKQGDCWLLADDAFQVWGKAPWCKVQAWYMP